MRRGLVTAALGCVLCALSSAGMGCSAVLGIDELPPLDDASTKDAARDARSRDASAPDATHPDAAKDATPKKDGGDGQASDAAPDIDACADVTSQCAPDGAILTCVAGKTQASSCEAGLVCAAADAGAACAPPWPSGTTACTVNAGQTWSVRVGSTLDCSSLTIAEGGTLELLPPESWDGGTPPDAGIAWTVIGVAGDAVIDGTIVGSWVGHGVDTVVTATAPAKNGADGGEALSFAVTQAAGGGGGPGGFPPGSCAASGAGPAAFGNGGGGGGGGAIETTTGAALYDICDTSFCPSPGAGFGSGADGNAATSTTGGKGGLGKTGTFATSTTQGTGGTAKVPNAQPIPMASVSGAGGGFRGKNGSLLLLVVKGSLSISGAIDLQGGVGGNGASGGSPTDESGFLDNVACNDSPSGPQYAYVSGGAAGGGGAGGAGGAFFLRVRGDAGSLAGHVFVDGGAGGGGGGAVVAASVGRSGDNGAAGIVNVGTY